MPPHLETSSLQKGYWALAAISFFWGTTWFVSKLTVHSIPPLQMTAIRQLMAGTIMISYFFIKNQKLPTGKELLFHLICGFLLIACSNGLTTWAIKYIPSFLGALISCLMPFVLILANYILYREKVKPASVFGLVIGFAGIAILLGSFIEEMKGHDFIFGILLSLTGVLTFTSGTLISTKNKMNINPFEGIGWQMLFGGMILLVASFITGQHIPLSEIPSDGWIELVYLCLIGSVFCFVCYLYALKTLPMSLVSIYVYINPIVALMLGVMILHEKLTWQVVIGILITFTGIYLVKRFAK